MRSPLFCNGSLNAVFFKVFCRSVNLWFRDHARFRSILGKSEHFQLLPHRPLVNDLIGSRQDPLIKNQRRISSHRRLIGEEFQAERWWKEDQCETLPRKTLMIPFGLLFIDCSSCLQLISSRELSQDREKRAVMISVSSGYVFLSFTCPIRDYHEWRSVLLVVVLFFQVKCSMCIRS